MNRGVPGVDFFDEAGQIIGRLGGTGRPIWRRGNESGGVHVHAESLAAQSAGLFQLLIQLAAFPRLDERDAVTAVLPDGGKTRLVDERRHAVAGAADDSGGPGAAHHGVGIILFGHAAAHVEGHAADGRGHDRHGQIKTEHRGRGVRRDHVVQKSHVHPDGFQGLDVGLERGTGTETAHSRHFAAQARPSHTLQTRQEPFISSRALSLISFISNSLNTFIFDCQK